MSADRAPLGSRTAPRRSGAASGWRGQGGPRGGKALVAGLLAGLLLLACSPGPSASGRAPAPPTAPPAGTGAAAPAGGGAAAPASLETVRFSYTTIAVSSAGPMWMALEGGYFREQGLDVELVFVDPGATVLAALSNGEVVFTQAGAPSLVLGYIQGLETMIVASAENILDSIVFVRPEIQRVEDLRGKTIGVSRLKAISDVTARLGFQRVGLVPDVDVFTRGTGGNAESLAAMETGAVDGASLSMPAAFEARKRGFRELLNITDLKLLFVSGSYGATKRVLAERPEMIDRTLRALAQAVARIATDREYSIKVIGKYSQSEDVDLLGATFDYYQPIWQRDLYPDVGAVQAVLDLEEHPAARTLKPQDVTDYRFPDRLRSSGFLDRLPR